jgi:hypothetical protein
MVGSPGLFFGVEKSISRHHLVTLRIQVDHCHPARLSGERLAGIPDHFTQDRPGKRIEKIGLIILVQVSKLRGLAAGDFNVVQPQLVEVFPGDGDQSPGYFDAGYFRKGVIRKGDQGSSLAAAEINDPVPRAYVQQGKNFLQIRPSGI